MNETSKLVRSGYENNRYLERFRSNHVMSEVEKRLLATFCSETPHDSMIVDLGCGSGIPYTKEVAETHNSVIGVDFVKKHIELGRQLNPNITFKQDDIVSFVSGLDSDSVGGYMALYSLYHLEKPLQLQLLEMLHKTLEDGGLFLCTLGTKNTLNLTKEFCGSTMKWVGYTFSEYKDILSDIGFTIVDDGFQSTDDDPENHYWVLLKK